jgi:hypothetical protein
MTCQECEVKLGMGENADQHLASCEECRWLAKELRLNAQAMRDMRVRPRMHWEWLAAAAAIVMAVIGWRMLRVEKLAIQPLQLTAAPPPAVRGPAPQKRVRRHRSPAPEPLRVKLFTSDPDVVIYWIVDKKEGYE